MSDAALPHASTIQASRRANSRIHGESVLVRAVLIAVSLAFLSFFLLLPLVSVFVEAGAKGWEAYKAAIVEPDALAAIRLTLLVAAIAVLVNTAVGIAAAWAVAKFEFRGKNLLVSLIDLPFSVSPVISGLVFVLLFGAQGYLGPWLKANDIRIVFAVPPPAASAHRRRHAAGAARRDRASAPQRAAAPGRDRGAGSAASARCRSGEPGCARDRRTHPAADHAWQPVRGGLTSPFPCSTRSVYACRRRQFERRPA